MGFGKYDPAVARHERIFGRLAPEPKDEDGRLSARFVEWMMGWPDGFATDHMSRGHAIRRLANGVVTRQAFAACGELVGPPPTAGRTP